MGFFNYISNLVKAKSNTTVDTQAQTTAAQEFGIVVPVASEVHVQEVVGNETSNSFTPSTINLEEVTYIESPNKSNRKDEVRGIVLHHTGPGSFEGIVAWLVNPEAKASAHYVVGTKGQITQLVNTKRCAWHAGKSKFLFDGAMRDDLNHCTIGIEICNAGVLQKGENGKFYYEAGRQMKEWKGATPVEGTITYPSGQSVSGYYPPYPEAQVEAVVQLCKALVEKYPQIGVEDIVTHYDIATPEGRKNDPFGLNMSEIIARIFS